MKNDVLVRISWNSAEASRQYCLCSLASTEHYKRLILGPRPSPVPVCDHLQDMYVKMEGKGLVHFIIRMMSVNVVPCSALLDDSTPH